MNQTPRKCENEDATGDTAEREQQPGDPSSLSKLKVFLSVSRECPVCGYNLRGIPGDRCPECGLDVEAGIWRRRLLRKEWAWLFSLRFMLFGLLPMFVWFPFAFALLRHTKGGIADWIAVITAILIGGASSVLSGFFAFDETEDVEAFVLLIATMLLVGGGSAGLVWAAFAWQ